MTYSTVLIEEFHWSASSVGLFNVSHPALDLET